MNCSHSSPPFLCAFVPFLPEWSDISLFVRLEVVAADQGAVGRLVQDHGRPGLYWDLVACGARSRTARQPDKSEMGTTYAEGKSDRIHTLRTVAFGCTLISPLVKYERARILRAAFIKSPLAFAFGSEFAVFGQPLQ